MICGRAQRSQRAPGACRPTAGAQFAFGIIGTAGHKFASSPPAAEPARHFRPRLCAQTHGHAETSLAPVAPRSPLRRQAPCCYQLEVRGLPPLVPVPCGRSPSKRLAAWCWRRRAARLSGPPLASGAGPELARPTGEGASGAGPRAQTRFAGARRRQARARKAKPAARVVKTTIDHPAGWSARIGAAKSSGRRNSSPLAPPIRALVSGRKTKTNFDRFGGAQLTAVILATRLTRNWGQRWKLELAPGARDHFPFRPQFQTSLSVKCLLRAPKLKFMRPTRRQELGDDLAQARSRPPAPFHIH